MTKALGRALTRVIMVLFGAINALSGRANPVEPPPTYPYLLKKEEYRP